MKGVNIGMFSMEVGKLKVVGDQRFASVVKQGLLVPVPVKTFEVENPRGENNAMELGRQWAEANQDKG